MIALALDLWMYTTEFSELGGGSGGSSYVPTYYILGF